MCMLMNVATFGKEGTQYHQSIIGLVLRTHLMYYNDSNILCLNDMNERSFSVYKKTMHGEWCDTQFCNNKVQLYHQTTGPSVLSI